MKEVKNINPLGTAPVPKLMANFAIPSIIGMLVSALYNIIDQLFIGQGVGTDGNAATNIAFPFSTLCIAAALLLGIGGASCFNLTMGKGDSKRAGYFAANAITMLTGVGIIITAFTLIFLTPLLKLFGSPDNIMPYAKDYVAVSAIGFPFLILATGGGHIVRADGSPGMTMILNLVGAVINTVLDALFVLSFGWGMKGAAAATVIGQFVSAVIVILYIRKFKTVKLTMKHFIPQAKIIGRICSIGMASCFNQLAIAIVQIVLNNSLRYYGGLSEYGETEPLAVAGIVMKVNMIVFSIVIGLAQGSQPIQSFNYGAKQFSRVKTSYNLALLIGGGISIVAFILFQAIPRPILSLFGTGTETYFEFGSKFFRIFLFFTWLNCIQPISSTFFTSIGKPIKGVFLSLTRQIIFFVPILLILPKFIGIDGILLTGPICDLLSGIVAVVMTFIEFRTMAKLSQNNEVNL